MEKKRLSQEIFIGLLIGEGSFTTHGSGKAAIAIKMSIRHKQLLTLVHETFGGKLYGPYHHQGRHYMVWTARGDAIDSLLPLLDFYLTDELCPHVAERYRMMRQRHEERDLTVKREEAIIHQQREIAAHFTGNLSERIEVLEKSTRLHETRIANLE